MRHPWQLKRRHTRKKTQDSEEICCDTCSATRVARQGGPAHVCNYVVHRGAKCPELSVLKRCVPKTLAFAFGLRLRSKTRCFKTRVF